MTATQAPAPPDLEVAPDLEAPGERAVDAAGESQLDAAIAPAGLTCWTAVLSTMAVAWLAGGVFEGWFARLVGLVAAGIGGGSIYLSTRARRPALVQYAGAGATIVMGAVLAVSSTGGADTDLAGLVIEALRGGGLGQPPLAFDAGWRFVLFVTVALLGGSSAGLAHSFNKPRMAALLALPFVVGGALLQPAESEIAATVVALLLLVSSLAVSMGAELAAQGAGSGAFEVRRLARGALALGLLGVAVYATAQVGFLFPPPAAPSVVPPMRPPPPPPAVDRVLFTVTADRQMTWRLGTLDVYDDNAWMTPPFDVSALVPVDGEIPSDVKGDTRGPLPAPAVTARIELAGLEGKTLPGLANPIAVRGADVSYDPRTQMLRAAGVSPPAGEAYEVVAPAPATGEVLSGALPPGAHALPFLQAPTPPAEVASLLAEAPSELFARLQFVRSAYFGKVVASGAGNPVDVPPRRVVEMLAGKEATPYEITAGEVLLARWAGVPARLGYGWFGGDERGPGTWEIRPKHGATWLEAYFEGSGWVPIVGTPPRAKPSTAAGERNEDPSVRPTDELALLVYVPIELSSVRLAYVLARHYLLASMPWVFALGLLAAFYPSLVRLARRTARRRTAARLGARAQIAAAYAEMRDVVTDLNIAPPAVSPLELLEHVERDDEHEELAWLVTRSLWGDLQRDIRTSDVDAAEVMSRSVSRRLRSAQPVLSRLASLASRASLRNPWTTELPTLWRPAGRRRTARLAILGVLLVGVTAGSVVALPSEPARSESSPLEDAAVPESIDDIRFMREQDAENPFRSGTARPLAVEGRIYSLRQGDVVQGSLQIVRLDPRFDTRSPRVRDQILSALGDARLRPARIGEERIFRLDQAEQTLMLAFAPDGHVYYLMTVRPQYAEADRLFASVLAFRRGERAEELRPAGVPVPDPRRGSPS